VPSTGRRSAPAIAALLGLAALAWLVVVREAGGMRSVPGTMGYGLAGFLGLWTLMMAAMMLPAVAPVGSLYVRAIARGRGTVRRSARLAGFVAGYVAAWAAFGLLAYAAGAAAGRLASSHPGAAGWAGAVVLGAAGIYQFTPAKDTCLTHCRSPIALLLHVGGFRGRLRDVRAGLYHGVFCVGCCWGLMAALIALGVMDLRWMALLAGVVVLEKLWRHGAAAARAVGVALLCLAVLAPFHPQVVPGLHPDGQMEMRG
jgi:predicted metal-binding membrane protein